MHQHRRRKTGRIFIAERHEDAHRRSVEELRQICVKYAKQERGAHDRPGKAVKLFDPAEDHTAKYHLLHRRRNDPVEHDPKPDWHRVLDRLHVLILFGIKHRIPGFGQHSGQKLKPDVQRQRCSDAVMGSAGSAIASTNIAAVFTSI